MRDLRSLMTFPILALGVATSSLGVATSSPAITLPPRPAVGFWNLQGNAGTTGGNFLGTTDNQGLELRVNNQRALRLDNASLATTWSGGRPAVLTGPTLLGGYSGNWIATGAVAATICGGGLRVTTTYPDSGIPGYVEDYPNLVYDVGGTVGGGAGNQAGSANGDLNDSPYATVSGGTVNRATAQAATIGGGAYNEASGSFSTVSGGRSNVASGDSATVPGGEENTAAAAHSLAAGWKATVRAQDEGTFVWSDGSDPNGVVSTGPDQFLVHAIGGVGINLNNPGAALDVNGDGRFSSFLQVGSLGFGGFLPLCIGANNQLAFCSSSLRYKTGIEPFAGGLDLVGRLHPISFTWREQGTKDVGLGAEQVEAVEPRLVTYNQEGGVEGVKYDRIAVVLINAVREQQAQIETQRRLIDEQRQRISELSSRLGRPE